jgi:DNA invertase Pin-like site-specific DNA recombinase
MVVGYVRLSRDDDKKNYSSIENQKELIQSYANNNGLKIDRFYEDDNISGYLFERPAFSEMLDRLETDIDIVIAKDLSRIGRKNGKVLLLLDRFEELEKRLILIDDNYDTLKKDDDIIGIKTWYNERYVKDTSKKIKSIVLDKQIKGNYICNAPFGYYVKNKKFFIRENEAEIVNQIFELYISGYGYRNIANKLTDECISTPSVLIMQNFIAEEKSYKKKVAIKWSDNMVRDILKNDFYIGVFRNKKRERRTIHGTDRRISKDNQYMFKNRHESIIDDYTFNLAQELMNTRVRSNYRGSKNNNEVSIFGSVLYCKDCGAKLTPITRKMNNGYKKYYICSKYNADGKKFCSSHLINEKELITYTIKLIQVSKETISKLISSYSIKDYEDKQRLNQKKIDTITKQNDQLKSKLKSIIEIKVRDLIKYDGNASVIEETYANMEKDVIQKIDDNNAKLQKIGAEKNDAYEVECININNVHKMLSNIENTITRKDVEYIVEKILVDNDGIPEIIFRNGINDYLTFNIKDILIQEEDNIINTVYNIIKKEERSYTSAKYVSMKLNEIGINKSKKSVLPYINLAIGDGILETTDNPLKPYNIVMDRQLIKCD